MMSRSILVSALVSLLLIDANMSTARATCSASCLNDVLDRYLAELVLHDPAPLPLAAGIVAVENAEPVILGDGSWQTIDEVPAGQRFVDALNGQAVFMGATKDASGRVNLTGQVVANRRFPVIDVEKGIVAALFIIPHGEHSPPNATNVAEIFKIVDGKIRSIEEFSFVGGFPPNSGFAD
jgi:hypothetical protein